MRRELARELRRNPKALLKTSFIKKAQAFLFDVPVTVRLNTPAATTPTTLAIAWQQPSLFIPWPGAPNEQPSAGTDPSGSNVVTSQLSGSFSMTLHFNRDTSGYGQPGVIETTQGTTATLQATGFPISDFSTACSPPQPALQVAPGNPDVTFVSAGASGGWLDLFGERASGILHLYPRFAGQRVPSCGATPYTTQVDAWAGAPLVVTYDGSFRLSPAITSDGRLRLGIMDITAQQLSSFGYVHACTADPSTVTAGGDTCQDAAYPARLSFQSFSAQVLIGGS